MMNYKKLLKGHWFLAAILLLFFTQGTFAKEKEPRSNLGFNKPSVTQSTRTLSDLNNWTYWMQWDGQSGRDPITQASGGFYPGNTLTSTIYADGFIWAGITTEPGATRPLRAGGSSYISGAVPGYINANGTRVTPDDDSRIRIFRIRSDWRTLTASQVRFDAAVLNNTTESSVSDGQIQEVIDQYKADWIDWPVELGAPYQDVNENGIYDPVLDADGAAIAREGDHPGIANADQVIWFVANDFNSSQTNEFLGALPLGLEYQVTAWSYNQANARLGQIIFKKYKFVNRSGFAIDSMYVSQWSDPDLGNFGDDVVGNDSTLSLGFVYNGGPTDDQYASIGLAPVAAGYDFFQGPIVESPGDTAIFDLQARPGYKNLPMTSFAFFAAGDPVITDPPLGDYNGTLGWFNLLRGFIPTFDVNNPTPFTHRAGPLQGRITKFPLNGEPSAQTGDLDGQGNNLAPGDRRLLLNSGPFKLPNWEDQNGDGLANFPEPGVQEIVVALLGGSGNTYLSSVDQLKLTDQVAQSLYNDLFTTVPKPPSPPEVDISPFREMIVLNWGNNPDAVAATEADNPLTGYNFEGYNVYQLPSSNATLDQAVKIATYDLVNGVTTIKGKKLIPQTGREEIVTLQTGSDNGIQRHITIDKNYITGEPLFPGNSYYFAVTAYNFNDFVDEYGNPTIVLIEDSTLESTAIIQEVVPRDPNPGEMLTADAGETFEVAHDAGGSDGIVEAKVIDPRNLTGDSYEVFFEEFQYVTIDYLTEVDSLIPLDTTYIGIYDSLGNFIPTDTVVTFDTTFTQFPDSMMQTALGWNVRNSDGDVLVRNQFQASSIDARNDQPLFDGIQVKVSGPPLTVKDWDWTSGEVSPLYPDYSDGRWISGSDWGGGALFGGLGMAHIFWGADPGIAPADFHAIEIRFTPMTAYDDTSGDGAYTFGAGGGEPYFFDTSKGQKAFMYETWGPGNYLGFNDIPFQVWDVEDPDNPRQLNVVVRDRDTNGRWDQGTGSGPYNYVWILADDYDPSGEAWNASTPDKDFMDILLNGPGGGAVPAYYVLWGVQRGSRAFLAEAGTLSLLPNKVITVADQYSFKATAAPSFNADMAKEEIEKINVFPNPYYAFNPLEQNRFNRFVKFSHLPQKATMRIFNLAGTLVRTIEKNSASQFQEWDLRNDHNFPVASGLYIVHIDMPDLSAEKVLKVFIIQGEEILEFF